MTRSYKRRNYFINQELQGKMIFTIFLFSLLGVAMFTLIFSLVSTDHLTISYTEQQFRIGATPAVLVKELFQANWLFIFLGGGLVSVVMLFISHAFAGPLYRFEEAFRGFNARDLDQHIHLRNKDIAQQLAAEINRFSSLYSADLLRLQELSAQLAELLEQQECAAAAALQKEMNQIVASYRLKPEA